MITEDKIRVFKDIYYYVPQSTAAKPIETLYEGLPKSQQYWRRQNDFPKFFYDYNPHLPGKKLCRLNANVTYYSGDKLVSLSVEDTLTLQRLVEREIRRMRNGIYVMNNGVRIYFPGPYYGLLQWVKMIGVKTNNGYGDHRRYQREFACQREKVKEDPKLTFFYAHKIKKCGLTQEISGLYAVESATNRQQTKVFMSKNHDTAKSANFKYFTYALKNFPAVLIPSIDQKLWSTAVQKIEIRCSDPELSLDNVVVAVPTTEDGTDGLPPIANITYSELPKYDNAEVILAKSREQLQLQQTKIGIGEIESYPPETDGKSFRYCKKLYEECYDLDETGYPKNRMVPLYIGLLEATNGTFDIYGEPDKLKALQMEQVARNACDTPAKLQARKRQYHMTAKEGWESGGSGSVFNNIALAEQEVLLEEQYNHAELNYIEYSLEWSAGRFTPLIFTPLTLQDKLDGKTAKRRMYCTKEYMEKYTNLCFKMPKKQKLIGRELMDLLQPPDDVFHASGADPVDYADTTQMGDKVSKCAYVTKDMQGNLLDVFWHRSEDPDEDIEELIKTILFWGSRAIVEGNRKAAFTTVIKNGMHFFMLIKHVNGQVKPYGVSMDIKPVNSTKDVISTYVGHIIRRIKNNLHQFKCIDIIRSHKDFESDNTQEYDLSVADGLCEIAIEALQTWVTEKKSQHDKYKHLGAILKRIA